MLVDVRDLGLADLIQDDDLRIIGAPIDFLGVNYYHDDNVSGHALPAGARRNLSPTYRLKASPFVGSEYVTFPSRDLPRTAMDWEVNPDGLRALLVRLGREYPNLPPLYVTENGAAFADAPVAEDLVPDVARVRYLRDHLRAARRAIERLPIQWGTSLVYPLSAMGAHVAAVPGEAFCARRWIAAMADSRSSTETSAMGRGAGVGIGGVLEPIQASPVIVEDGAFIGSRVVLVEGVVIASAPGTAADELARDEARRRGGPGRGRRRDGSREVLKRARKVIVDLGRKKL